jgi:hypothetical protein
MPRQRSSQRMLGEPTPTLMAATGGVPTLMAAGDPVVLTVYQGDDKRWQFKLKKDLGAPFPLTGYTAALQFRTAVADSAPQFVEPTVTVSNPAEGEITVELRSELSKKLVQPSYLWDLEITETASSWTTTIAVGTLTVTKEVTRSGSP